MKRGPELWHLACSTAATMLLALLAAAAIGAARHGAATETAEAEAEEPVAETVHSFPLCPGMVTPGRGPEDAAAPQLATSASTAAVAVYDFTACHSGGGAPSETPDLHSGSQLALYARRAH